jgi:hypothetical protein
MTETPSLALMTPPAQLLLPLFLHFGLVVGLYAALTWARLVAVRRGEVAKNDFARADGDPPVSARIQRNLTNQFEAPVFAWIAALLLILTDQVGTWDVAAAWVFSGRPPDPQRRPVQRRQCRPAGSGVHDQLPGPDLADGARRSGCYRLRLTASRPGSADREAAAEMSA